jgi:hypothetical protein
MRSNFINDMRQFLIIISIISFCLSCSNNKSALKQSPKSNVNVQKGECYISPNESFDSLFIINGNQTRLKCITECYGEFIVNDTINDSTIVQYRNRRFIFTLKNQKIDTQIVVTKDLVKEVYENEFTFKNSVIASPRIDSIDALNNSILLSSFFLYPHGLAGTDFFETILFEITLNGKVNFKKIIPYEEPRTENLDANFKLW